VPEGGAQPRPTQLVGGGALARFSSRLGRLSHVYLKDQLTGASEYLRIAGYFRSSIFDLVNEEIESIGKVRVVCNADLDPLDIGAARQAREQMLKERWNDVDDSVESFLRRPRYRRLYEMLKKGNIEIRVVSRADAPFLHGKAGVIRRPDGSATAFMGSLNETREGWSQNYELVWEDSSADGVAWVEEEFEHLWNIGKPLPDAIVDEIGRSARRVEVQLEELGPADVAPAALVESDLYRGGEQLMPWQRAFVGLFLHHREVYGRVRLLLADEVGVGKTLSLAGSALVSALLGDGPVLILCPATLTGQWQMELKDKLNIPSAVWLSSEKAWQIDPDELPLPSAGANAIVKCPRQIAIVSTGMIFRMTEERRLLLSKSHGLVILDEAHRARGGKILGQDERKANNLLTFMVDIARRTRHLLLGTATPIQTDVADLWDLMNILAQGVDFVLGDWMSRWREQSKAVPLINGREKPTDERDAWQWFRNPIPPAKEADVIFGHVRNALSLRDDTFVTDVAFSQVSDEDDFIRSQFEYDVLTDANELGFFQRNNPVVRHVVLRRRQTLEDEGLMPRIAVDVHPMKDQTLPSIFAGVGLQTSANFDVAYEAAEKFTKAFAKRRKSAGLLKNLVRQRLCSSIAAGHTTARRLLEGRQVDQREEDDSQENGGQVDHWEIVDEERQHLQTIVNSLGAPSSDPKLEAVIFYLLERGWLDLGCIVFSQYYDTARWVGDRLTTRLPHETIAVYAGAGRSGLLLDGEWKSIDRDHIKKAVRERRIRLVVATDAACEGLNLQTLGTLVNVDLPWNPSRLEQRIGRIKRFGQRRDRVDVLNLVYHGTVDEKVYETISERMRQRFDIFGSLPDVIEDEWIEDIESLDAKLREFTERKKSANAFDLRYAAGATSDDQRWELCERVLARIDVQKRLSLGWGERGESKQSEGKAPGEKRVSREMPLDESAQRDLGVKEQFVDPSSEA
jgi:superfamily II DNA or RNA helicase